MTDNTKKSNNLFNFATSELSQDAFFCWSLNWLAVKEDTDDPYYKYGKAMLDLFLGDNKKEEYTDVLIKKQFVVEFRRDENNNPIDTTSRKKSKGIIDILALFKFEGKTHALIIEDKTYTSEHSNQIAMYKNNLSPTLKKSNDAEIEPYKDLPSENIYTAYVKTGLMYNNDFLIKNNGTSLVGIENLITVISNHTTTCKSSIINDYIAYLESIIINYKNIAKNIDAGNYDDTLSYEYGRYYFLDSIFNEIVEEDLKKDLPMFADSNNGGDPWTHYTFWNNPKWDTTEKSRPCLFWRVDCFKSRSTKQLYKIELSLRYRDENGKDNYHTSNINKDLIEYVKSDQFKTFNIIIEPSRSRKYACIEKSVFKINIKNLKELSYIDLKSSLIRISQQIVNHIEDFIQTPKY